MYFQLKGKKALKYLHDLQQNITLLAIHYAHIKASICLTTYFQIRMRCNPSKRSCRITALIFLQAEEEHHYAGPFDRSDRPPRMKRDKPSRVPERCMRLNSSNYAAFTLIKSFFESSHFLAALVRGGASSVSRRGSSAGALHCSDAILRAEDN